MQQQHLNHLRKTNLNIIFLFFFFSQAAGNSRTAAVAAIRAAVQRNENILSVLHSNPIEMMFGSGVGSSKNEHRNRLRQMLLDEFTTSGHSNNNLQRGEVETCGSGCRAMKIGANRTQGGGWNDDFVLRQQFEALIPAFDPRPGRTNINQVK